MGTQRVSVIADPNTGPLPATLLNALQLRMV